MLLSESDMRRFTLDGACLEMSEGVRRFLGFFGLLGAPLLAGPGAMEAGTTLVACCDMAFAYMPAPGGAFWPGAALQPPEAGGCMAC